MKLKGTEPAESIDLSMSSLTVLSAAIIAGLLGSNAATKSLNLRLNQLDAEAAKHLADMLTVNKTLTSVRYALHNPFSTVSSR